MEYTMNNGFAELSATEMNDIDGGVPVVIIVAGVVVGCAVVGFAAGCAYEAIMG